LNSASATALMAAVALLNIIVNPYPYILQD